jgi:hypothetical protein
MIICPGCRAENKDGVEVCPYCGTSLATAAPEAGTRPPSDSKPQPDLGPQPVPENQKGLVALEEEVEHVVKVVVPLVNPPVPPGAGPKPNVMRSVLMIAMSVLVAGGGSGFAGFRMGVNRGASPAEVKILEDLKKQLQGQQGANSNLDATIKQLKQQLAEKQVEIDALTKDQSAAGTQVGSLKASLASTEQKLRKAQAEAATLQTRLDTERQRPKVGMIEWSGDLGKKDDSRLAVEIENGRASIGSLHGPLPGAACTVMSGNPAASISAPPSQASPNRFGFQVKGKGKMIVRLFWSAC